MNIAVIVVVAIHANIVKIAMFVENHDIATNVFRAKIAKYNKL